MVVKTSFPKFWFDQGPHSRFSAGFRRSQSGTKLRLLSVHARFVINHHAVDWILTTSVRFGRVRGRHVAAYEHLDGRPSVAKQIVGRATCAA